MSRPVLSKNKKKQAVSFTVDWAVLNEVRRVQKEIQRLADKRDGAIIGRSVVLQLLIEEGLLVVSERLRKKDFNVY